jgi:hypothetical protein
MKKKRLALNRETIRLLEAGPLKRVAGALEEDSQQGGCGSLTNTGTADSICAHTCGTVCPTGHC